MRVGLMIVLVLWALVTLSSLGALTYLLPSYGIDGAFAQALRSHPDLNLQRWFHALEGSFLVGVFMTSWLWRTYKHQYGGSSATETARHPSALTLRHFLLYL